LNADESRPSQPPGADKMYHPTHGMSGEDFARILSLSDGVFAFSLTLLALSLTVPVFDTSGLSEGQASAHLASLLWPDYGTFLGYVFAFVMIAIWWVVHNRTFQNLGRYDSGLVWLNMAVLLQIAVMPFVLAVYNHYSDTQVAIALFAAIQVGLGITNALLWDYARRMKLLKPGVPVEYARTYSRRSWLTAAVFALSIGLTFVNLDLAEFSWAGTFLVQRFLDHHA
jgi:uncharacterized membrane protein